MPRRGKKKINILKPSKCHCSQLYRVFETEATGKQKELSMTVVVVLI